MHGAPERFGGARLPTNFGDIALYGIAAPTGSREIGEVMVEGSGDDANLDALLPALKRRVADLGASAAVIERVESDFRWVTELQPVPYTYACGYRRMCSGMRLVPITREVRLLRLYGRALLPPVVDARAPGASPPSAVPVEVAPRPE